MKKIALIFIMLFPCFVHAFEIKEVVLVNGFVDERECEISGNSIAAATESALRYNNIQLKKERSANSVEVSVWGSASELEGTNTCALTFGITVSYLTKLPVKIGSLQKTIDGEFNLCTRKIQIWGGPKYDFQSRVNNRLKIFTDECLSQIRNL
jgi:hypothetical protein